MAKSIEDLTAEIKTLKVTHNEKITELNETLKTKDSTIEELQKNSDTVNIVLEGAKDKILELEALAEKNPAAKLIVNGVFKHGAKKYTFKDGWLNTRNLNNEVVSSEEALEDKELMHHLIKIKYAGIELVK